IGDISDSDVTAWHDKTDAQKKNATPNFKANDGEHLYWTYTIPAEDTKYSTWTDVNEVPQEYAAVYARVLKTKILDGKVQYKADFKEAEDIEPID
nr:hypothetical protein [Treponema sp.]